MDKLEEFINNNREEFDQATPSKRVWESISQDAFPVKQFEKQNRIINMRWAIGLAASVFIAVMVWTNFPSKIDEKQDIATVDPLIESIDPGYAVQVKSFNDQIMIKQNELLTLLKDFPDLSIDLVKNLDRLNTSYNNLRQDLPQTANQEVLLEAMIENLNLQVTILNQQLNLIQQIKNEAQHEVNI